MEVRDAIKLAVDHLAEEGAPEEVAPRLVEGGYSAAKAEGLSAACVLACETARASAQLDLAELQETLTAAGTRPDLAALIAVEVFSEQSPELRLGEVSGVPVLQLLGDLGQLSPEELLGIREEILEPLFARDCRLVVDLGGLSDAPLEVFGILCSDLATLRAAGGDLVLTGLDAETAELATAYRLGETIPIASDPQAALERLAKLPATPASGKRFVVLRGAAEGAGILAVRGAIDARSVERAERKVRKVLAKHPRLVLDLREVPWISSEGFAFLRAITAELGERIEVARILGPAGAAAEAAGLSETVRIHADRRAALDAFGVVETPAAPDPAATPELESEDLASDEVVEAEDPAAEKAETQAAPAAEPAPSPDPTPESTKDTKPKRSKGKRRQTKRQATEQRKLDLEAAKQKAARTAKRAAEAASTPEEPAPQEPASKAAAPVPQEPVPEEPVPEEPEPEEPTPEEAPEEAGLPEPATPASEQSEPDDERAREAGPQPEGQGSPEDPPETESSESSRADVELA